MEAMMEQHPEMQQLDLVVLATREVARQRLNPALRIEIIDLLRVLLNECVVVNPNVEVDDDEDHA
jgi:hypothetical protein